MTDKPWESEPNEESFDHAGFECLLRRHPTYGHWNGYVGIPKTHPLNRPSTDLFADFDIHDGISYSSFSLPDGSRQDKWWVGFSCGSTWDVRPFVSWNPPNAVYRTIDYAREHLRKLAEQVKGLER